AISAIFRVDRPAYPLPRRTCLAASRMAERLLCSVAVVWVCPLFGRSTESRRGSGRLATPSRNLSAIGETETQPLLRTRATDWKQPTGTLPHHTEKEEQCLLVTSPGSWPRPPWSCS